MSNGEKTVRRFTTAALGVIAFLGGIWISFGVVVTPVAAVVGTNEQINFQGRLFNAQGAVVPDGYYNVEFKIYQDGTGQAVGNPDGTLRWTESHLNNNSQGIQVKNGYMSVELGSVNAFGSQVDWNQSVLWLSMNIGNTNTSCASFAACGPDGEMTPMKRLSSSVYAMNANKLGGLTAAGFIQNQNVAAQTTTNFWIDGTGRATTLQAATSVNTPALRSVADSTTGIQVQNTAGTTTIMNIDTQNARVGIGTSAPSTSLHVATNDATINQPALLVEQQGSGDASLELRDGSGKSFYVGMDRSSGSSFKISSSTSVQSSLDLGTTAIGGSATTSLDNTIMTKKVVTGAQGGTLSSVSVHVTSVNTANPDVKVGLYAHDAANNRPGTLLTSTTTGQALVSGWNTLPLSAPIAAATTYWIGIKSEGTSGVSYSYCGGCGGDTAYYSPRPFNDAWPTTPGAPTSTSNNENYSWYMTVAYGTITDTYGGPDLFKLTDAGALTLQNSVNTTSALQVQNAAGSTVMNVDTLNGRLGVGTATPTSTLQVAGTLTSAGGGISLNDSSNFTVSIGGGTSTGTLTIGNSANTTNLGSNTINLGNATAATTLQKMAQTTTDTAGAGLTIRGATGNGTGAGGQVAIQGGDAGATNANGGNLLLSGGAGSGTGSSGLVVITTPTFQTAMNDSNCYTGGALVAASCTISATSVNNNAAIVIGFSTDGQTATLPNPGITTAGRIVYLTAANGSKDFTISVNSGGVGNQVAMRQNTSATMIWNGTDWTAAGASSSTTLQSAYDNTLQSAGGAELVVSKTSSTNGLTIRDSSTAPVNGTLLSVQSSSAASLLSVNSNVTEYAANGGAETPGGSPSTFPASTWSGLTGTTASRHASAGDYIATGQGSVSAVTTAVADAGVKNQLSSALNANTTYNVSFTARLASGTFTDMNVYYSVDGTAASVLCTTGATPRTSIWTKINCTFTTPMSGISASNAILIRQTGATARTFYVDNLAVNIAANYNFATDPSVNNAGAFTTNWTYTTGTGTGSATRNTADGNDASDSASVTITSGAANAGIRNRLNSNPLPNTLYRATAYVKSTSSFTDFKMRYSRDNGTSFVDCVDYNTQTISTTEWTKVTCYIKTDASAASNPYVYFVEAGAAARTFMVDTFSLTLATSSTPNIQVGGGVNGGPTTLLTLDKGASAPIANDNEALLGSMYYDTTLGKLQCFESDGWGACGSSPDTVVTISPEYNNAVLHGTGVGTMVSDICSDTLNINDGSSSQPTICGTNETYNFYKWTSPQASAQTYSIYVTYQLPSNFSSFASGKTSIMGRTDSTNSTVNYQVYRNDASSGMVACGSPVAVSTGSVSSWQTGVASGTADPSTCSFAAGNSIVFKINVTASQNASAYVGNLNFTFNNR
jgi:hypothetical protein